MCQLIPFSVFASYLTTSPQDMDPNSVEYRNWKDSLVSDTSITTSSAVKIETSTTTSSAVKSKTSARTSLSLISNAINVTVNNQLENEYISVATSDVGRFTIGTTGGDPDNTKDDNKKLLYGHPSPRTSYTTLKIDNNNYTFSSSQQTTEGNSKISDYSVGDISVEQVLSIVNNSSTNREDTVQVKYIVKNNGTEAHDAGIRIMMDTMLGNNDAAPFRIPNIGAVTSELELSGDNIPEYWQAFDSLTNPSVISQGTLVKDGELKPDKVQFTNWSRVYNTSWGYNVNTSAKNGDSAVSVIWNPADILPGEQREYTTYYGISEFDQDLTPPLALSLTGATNIEATDTGYSPNPFTVTAYVMNIGSGTAKNTYADIKLPEGLMLASGEDTHKAIGDLLPGQEKQISFKVYVADFIVDQNLSYAVSVSADGTDTKTLARNITIPASKVTNNTSYHLGSSDIDGGTSCEAGDPVNVANGNFTLQRSDISVPGGNPLKFSRFYNSRDYYQGILGSNWHNSFDFKLKNNNEKIRITYNDGHIEDFTLNSDGTYSSMVGKYDKLMKNNDGTFTLKTKDNTSYYFDEDGKIIAIEDIDGNKNILTYDSDNLVKVENSSGYLSFEYAENLISKVTDSTGRTVEYGYTGNNLTSIKDVDGNTSKYEYDDNNRIIKIIDALNIVTLENVYDSKGRVIQQIMADGSECSFSYDDDANTTTYTDGNGSKVTYKRDNSDRVYESDYENGSQKITFNDNNQIIEFTDKNGNTYSYEYDDNGNATKETDPLGNVKEYTYDSNNKVTSIKNADGSIYNYTYDSKGNMLTATDPLGRAVSMEYNSSGLPVKLIQPNSAFTNVQYDDNGNPIVITDAEGNVTTYSYDSLNRVKTITKPLGNKIEYDYTASGKIQKVTYADGTTSSSVYDARGLLTQSTDQAGRTTNYQYNDLGKISEITDASGGTTKYEYDSMCNVSKVTKPDGSVETYEYNAANKLETVTDGENNTKTYSYDNNGNITNKIDANGNESSLIYDALNRIIKVTDANNASTQYEYTYNGKIKKVTDALNGETDYDYDAAGQLIYKKDATGAEIKYTYNNIGNMETVTDAKGNVTKYEYNNNGKVTKVTKADGTVEKLEYDKNGNLIRYTDPKGNVTTYTYDTMERLVSIKNANGGTKNIEYTPSGKVSSIVDENGNKTSYQYDVLDRMQEVTDANGGKTTYVYDAVGNLIEVHQYQGITSDMLISMKKDKGSSDNKEFGYNKKSDDNKESGYNTDLKEIVTKYTYDKRGLLLQETDPANKVKVYTYDANGNLISKTDKDGQATKYEYDAVNNLSKVNYSDGKQVSYSYNPLNQVSSMTDWLGTTNYKLDALGRITKVTDYQNKVTEYSYNNIGEKQSIKYPDGSTVSYAYDTMGRLTTVTDGQNKVTTYKYDELGNVIEKLLPNGVKTVNSYDVLSRINAMTDYNERGKIIDNYKYSYDAVGNKIQVDQSKYNDCDLFKRPGKDGTEGKTQYKYDGLNQLTQVTKPDQSIEKYFYDTIGNRIEKQN